MKILYTLINWKWFSLSETVRVKPLEELLFDNLTTNVQVTYSQYDFGTDW